MYHTVVVSEGKVNTKKNVFVSQEFPIYRKIVFRKVRLNSRKIFHIKIDRLIHSMLNFVSYCTRVT